MLVFRVEYKIINIHKLTNKERPGRVCTLPLLESRGVFFYSYRLSILVSFKYRYLSLVPLEQRTQVTMRKHISKGAISRHSFDMFHHFTETYIGRTRLHYWLSQVKPNASHLSSRKAKKEEEDQTKV